MSLENAGATTTAYTAAKNGTSEHTTQAIHIKSIFSDAGVSLGENLSVMACCDAFVAIIPGVTPCTNGNSVGRSATLLAYPNTPLHTAAPGFIVAELLGADSRRVSTTGPCPPKMLRVCRLSRTLFFRRVVAKSTLSKMALIATDIDHSSSFEDDVLSL